MRRTGSGPAATKSSLPTLSAQASGSSRPLSASACAASAKSSATMTLGSGEAIGSLGASWRIRLPFTAARAAPVVLLGAEAALLAAIHAEALDVLPDQSF